MAHNQLFLFPNMIAIVVELSLLIASFLAMRISPFHSPEFSSHSVHCYTVAVFNCTRATVVLDSTHSAWLSENMEIDDLD